MTPLLSGINLALRALLAHQDAIQTIEHNVANSNVPGYRRQEVLFAAGSGYPAPGLQRAAGGAGQLGTGMDAVTVRRYKLEVIDAPYWRTLAETSYWNSRSASLQRVEAALPENAGAGLISKLDEFWAGWRALSSDPTDLVLRAQVRDRTAALATAFNQREIQLQGVRSELGSSMGSIVDEINQSALHIARLNEKIAQVLPTGHQPNDLLDQRDRLLDRLVEISGAVTHEQENGQVAVSIGGHALVVAGSTFTLQFSGDVSEKAVDRLSWSDSPGDPVAIGGQLAGLVSVYDKDIQEQLDGLNDLAFALIEQVNAAHKGGFGLDSSTNLKLFDGMDASSIALSLDISAAANPLDKIAAAGAELALGDGSKARAIAEIQSEAFIGADPVKRTVSETYIAQMAGLGQSIKLSKENGEAQGLLYAALHQQRESASGVSLDEEAANLVKYQRTYQALSRLMTSLDEMLDQVINGMGRVGR